MPGQGKVIVNGPADPRRPAADMSGCPVAGPAGSFPRISRVKSCGVVPFWSCTTILTTEIELFEPC